MKQTIRVLLLMCLVWNLTRVKAQTPESHEDHNPHKLTVAITHTLVPTAVGESGEKKWLTLASWGLDYDYEITEKWGIGLHSDFVIQNFMYEHGDVIKERKSPFAIALVARRKVGQHITLMAGGGAEFSHGEETLALARIGADYGWELPDNWDLSFALLTDLKINAYNSMVVGFGLGKKF